MILGVAMSRMLFVQAGRFSTINLDLSWLLLPISAGT
jgi:hypothetical protein